MLATLFSSSLLGIDAVPALDEALLSGDNLTRENAARALAIIHQA